jgi:hypothetical protein
MNYKHELFLPGDLRREADEVRPRQNGAGEAAAAASSP